MPETEATSRDPFQLAGTTIDGKYRVASVIGDGGFGVVYRAVHLGFGEVIAVKCLKLPHALDEKQRDGFLEQLREEGRLLHRLSKATPGIVQALDVGALTAPSGGWVPYLVLEWLDGETLADHLEGRLARGEGPFPLTEAVRLLEPAARALGVAHALKVAHRDVKPHNLFVAKVGDAQTLKVLDFGIAKVLTDYTSISEALAATNTVPTAFTPRYGAPEQFNKQRGATGPWTDVFALALILVELLTGKKALEGDDPTQLYVAAADPTFRPTPRARGAEVPDLVERVLDKALAIEPKNRYADAGELWDALLDATGLLPSTTFRLSARPAAPRASRPSAAATPADTSGSVATAEYAARARLALDRAPPPTAGGTQQSAQSLPLEATRPAEAPGSITPGAVVIKPDPARTAVSPGVEGASAAADPMSETPFFDRHHLPPSGPAPEIGPGVKAAAGPRAGVDKPAPEAAKLRFDPAPPAGSRTPWLVAAALLTAGGAGAWYFTSSWKLDLHPSGAPSASASSVSSSKRRPPPPRRVTAVPAPSGSASAASSATTPPDPAARADMVLVAPATFKMGEGDGAREVTLTKGFYLDRHEVTVRAYEGCLAKRMCGAADRVALPPGTGERWAPADLAAPVDGDAASPAAEYIEGWSRRCNAPRGAGDHPINCVDYAAAEAYCRWVGKRLPTEAEWELAARGAEGRAYPWGADGPECARACYDRNGGCRSGGQEVTTCASGLHAADRTPEGLYDLGGNVAEWVSDGFASGQKAVRGGSFIDGDDQLKATSRAGAPPGLAHVGIGFRCAADGP